MTKRDFIDQYEIKDALPVDPSRRVIPADALYSALCDFLEERFRGAVYAKKEPATAQSVLICADYAAYFFKMLLTYVYGREMLYVTADSQDEHLSITITSESDLPLTDSEMRSLIRLARDAGMDIYPEARKVRLTLSFSAALTKRVYAISVGDGKLVILAKLSEIFYCGEPLAEDTSTSLITERRRRDPSYAKKNKQKTK